MTNADISKWLDVDDQEIIDSLKNEIRNHVKSLKDSGIHFYGYSIYPGDYCTTPDWPFMCAVFNEEKNVKVNPKYPNYYRYCVDEWPNWIQDGFDQTNSAMKKMRKYFDQNYQRDPELEEIDEYENRLIDKLHRALLVVLCDLKGEGVFDDDIYLVIWISASDHEIMRKSVERLNTKKVFGEYINEFE